MQTYFQDCTRILMDLPFGNETWLVGNPPQIGSHENWWHRRLTICLFPSYSVGLYIPMTSLFVVRLSPTNHHIPYRIALQHLRWEVPTEFGQSPPEVATLVVWWRKLFSHHHFWYNMMQNEHWWTLDISMPFVMCVSHLFGFWLFCSCSPVSFLICER